MAASWGSNTYMRGWNDLTSKTGMPSSQRFARGDVAPIMMHGSEGLMWCLLPQMSFAMDIVNALYLQFELASEICGDAPLGASQPQRPEHGLRTYP